MSILDQDPNELKNPEIPDAVVNPSEVIVECIDMRRYGLGNEVIDPDHISNVEYTEYGTSTITNEKGGKQILKNFRIKISLLSGVVTAFDVTDEEKAVWVLEEIAAIKNKIVAAKYRR